jgi:hypothetical protein
VQGIQGPAGSGGGGGLSSWIYKTSNYTATTGDQIIANTSGGSFTITLPPTPSIGNIVRISDGADWRAYNLTVARNGSTIEGLSENLTVDLGLTILDLIYDGTTWQVFSSLGAQGPAGPTGSGGGTGTINELDAALFS